MFKQTLKALALTSVLLTTGCMKINEDPSIWGTMALISNQSLSWNDTVVGTTRSVTLTVQNVGEVDTSLVSFSPVSNPLFGTVFKVIANGCGDILMAKATCQLEVSFSPMEIGQYSLQYIVTYFDGR